MISIIIPCFNSGEFIGRALDSVLDQVYDQYEIIVVDNGSTDNTLNIVNDYKQKRLNNIRILREEKKGAPAARNRGLFEARGEWIQFLDSDDELLPYKLEQQIHIADGSAFDIIIGSCLIYHCNQTTPEVHTVEHKNVWEGLALSKLGRTSSNLWRRQALLSVDGWDEDLTSSQEYNLIFKLLKHNECVGYDIEPQTKIYLRENSLHKSTNKDRIIEVVDNNIRLRLKIKQYLNENDKLTSNLAKTIDIYIHRYLKFHRLIIPEYVNQTLDELNLDLPITYLLKRELIKARKQVAYYKSRVKNFIS